MGVQRILVIGIGTVAMLVQMLMRRKAYPQIFTWKMPIISILLTISGVAGAMLMYFIESGHFGGTSFFGAVLLIPVFMFIALPLHIPYGILMDLCAPAVCLMLAFMKVDCQIAGCCIGKYIPSLGFQFPSQMVEMIVALVIMVVLIRLEWNSRNKNALYAYYLIFYGVTRFILNWFRYGVKPFVWILPAGNFWSVIAISIGLLWICVLRNNINNQ